MSYFPSTTLTEGFFLMDLTDYTDFYTDSTVEICEICETFLTEGFFFSQIKQITRIFLVASVGICVNLLTEDIFISHGLDRFHGIILLHPCRSVKSVRAFSRRIFLFLTD